MKRYITPNDPTVKLAVQDILNSSWRWAYNDFNALRQWVSTHVNYASDEKVHSVTEYWQLPSETLELRSGDCEDFAILLCTLLRANGVPADQVYVAVGKDQKGQYHGYLVERYYTGIWRAIEPEEDVWTALMVGEFLGGYEEAYCFNDVDYIEGKPALPPGVYALMVDYSFWPITRGAPVTLEGYLNAADKVTASVGWLKDDKIIYDWVFTAYDPQGTAVLTWSGKEKQRTFSFTAPVSGTYKVGVVKKDYLARGVEIQIYPPAAWRVVPVTR